MGLLQELGYGHLVMYPGGLADWIAHGGALESGARGMTAPPARAQETAAPAGRHPATSTRSSRLRHSGDRVLSLIDALAARSVGDLLGAWLALALAFGLIYWIATVLDVGALLEAGAPVRPDLRGLTTAIYFSFITAMSVGYGDVVPVGIARVLAVVEAAAGLLIFGFVISKFVSRRQEEVVAEIHRIAFEDHLGRVQTNLHLVLSDLQAIAEACSSGGTPPARTRLRIESTAMVFSLQLRTIHDLLYRPQQTPEEPVLEEILASLAASFSELTGLIACLPQAASPSLESTLHTIARYGVEICGECVPRAYAPALKGWMDEIQRQSRQLTPAARA